MLYNFRNDNPSALIALENDVSVVHGIPANNEIQFKSISSDIDCYTKIDKMENKCLPSS